MTYQFALVGNPNSGKTSTFNQLTGAKQTVGNWPGVTVERKSGKLRKAKEITIQDLPGIYSLSPYTPEEVISRNYLAEAPIDAVLDIVDGTNLERNLYLTLQLLEMGLPTIVGINMIDLLKRKGIQINFEKLAYGLGVPVVGISALKQQGLNKLIDAAKKRAGNGQSSVIYDSRLEAALAEIIGLLPTEIPESKRRWIAVKLFEGDELIRQQVALTPSDEKELAEIIKITEMIFDEQSDAIIVNERYGFIQQLLALATVKEEEYRLSLSDKIDRVLTHRLLALPIFALFMWGIYFLSIQSIGTMGTDWVNDVLFGSLVGYSAAADEPMASSPMAAGIDPRWDRGGCRGCPWICSTNFCALFLLGVIRRLRLHGTHRFCDGSLVPQVWFVRKVFHSDADRYWLWCTWGHGQPDY